MVSPDPDASSRGGERPLQWKSEATESASAEPSPLLEDVLRETEAAVVDWGDDDDASDVQLEAFSAVAVQAGDCSDQEAILVIVRQAIPKWVRNVLQTDAAWEKLTAEIAELLFADQRSRERMMALWQRLRKIGESNE